MPVLEMKITPIVEFDEKVSQWVASFKEFPQVTAIDETEEKAIHRLLAIFEVFFREEEQVVLEAFVRANIERLKGDNRKLKLIKSHEISPELQEEQMELQLA